MASNRSKGIRRHRAAYRGRYKKPKFTVTRTSWSVQPVVMGTETVAELQASAKAMGLKGYSKLNKPKLIELLRNSKLVYS